MTARSVRGTFILLAVLATVALATNGAIAAQPMVSREDPPLARGDADTVLRTSSVMFIENAGQWPDAARFQVWGGTEGTMWLAEDAIWITVAERAQGAGVLGDNEPDHDPTASDLRPAGEQLTRAVSVKLSFVGANRHPRIEPFGRLDTAVSYLIGDDPAAWRPNVPVWGGVRYVELYPGVDLELTSEGGQLVQRLAPRSDADPGFVKLRVEGPDAVTMDGGTLRARTAVGEAAFPSWQGADLRAGAENGQRRNGQAFDVTASFTPATASRSHAGASESSAALGGSDGLLYGTYLGGSKDDIWPSIAVDDAGNAYVTGTTESTDFPTVPGGFKMDLGGSSDVFVAKLNGTGTALIYASFVGGSRSDRSSGIAVDKAGNAYLTGITGSSDFPVTPGAFDARSDGAEAFAIKLNAAGSALIYSTLLGGSDDEFGYGNIAIASDGSAYVTGATLSSDFPTSAGSFATELAGESDAFIVRLNASGTAVFFSSFLGGSGLDEGRDVAVDGEGCAHITGYTFSRDFPTTPGAFDTSYNDARGRNDGFVVKLSEDGKTLVYSTFLGGRLDDFGWAIGLDGMGQAYVAGTTISSDFPTTPGASDTEHGGGTCSGYLPCDDIFVVKLSTAGSTLLYGTYLGGSKMDWRPDIAVSPTGHAFLTGETWSGDFPTTQDAFDTNISEGYGDAFVTELDAAGAVVRYSTFLGSSGRDTGRAIAVDETGCAYVAGQTGYRDFPVTAGAFDVTHSAPTYPYGIMDAFVVRLAMGGAASTLENQVNFFAAQSQRWLDEVRAEARLSAEDGDYFAGKLTEDAVSLIVDDILGSITVVSSEFSDYTAQLARDAAFPGVGSNAWEQIKAAKQYYGPAWNAFDASLDNPITPTNAWEAARTFLSGAEWYLAADLLEKKVEDLGEDQVKHALAGFLQQPLRLQQTSYPGIQDLIDNALKPHVQRARDETIAELPALTSEQVDLYVADLIARDKANLRLAFALERRGMPLHFARDDSESGGGGWISSFLAKYGLKKVATLRWGQAALVWVNLASMGYDVFKGLLALDNDTQMMSLGVQAMFGATDTAKAIHANSVNGIANIRALRLPHLPKAQIEAVNHRSVGHSIRFIGEWWVEEESYTDIAITSVGDQDATVEALVDYSSSGLLGSSFRPLLAEGMTALPGQGSATVRVYYVRDGQGASPDDASAISIDMLGTTDTGVYYLDHAGLAWNPMHVDRSTGNAALPVRASSEGAAVPTLRNPVRSSLGSPSEALSESPSVWVENPFPEAVTVAIVQPLPAGIVVLDAGGGEISQTAVTWRLTLQPGSQFEVTYRIRYAGTPGTVVTLDGARVLMTDIAATQSVSFTGNVVSFSAAGPLDGQGKLPPKIRSGETADVPFMVRNRSEVEASGRLWISALDNDGHELYQAEKLVTLGAGAKLEVVLPLTITGRPGWHILKSGITSNGGETPIAFDYLLLEAHRLYLPVVLRQGAASQPGE